MYIKTLKLRRYSLIVIFNYESEWFHTTTYLTTEEKKYLPKKTYIQLKSYEMNDEPFFILGAY